MSVNLVKGQKIDLTKSNAGLKKVVIGLGWDMVGVQHNNNEKKNEGIFSGLFNKKGNPDIVPLPNIDCDAFAFVLNKKGELDTKKDVVFFNNLKHSSGCVIHKGDNLTGAGEGDDEQICVDLQHLPAQYDRIAVLVSIYQATQRNQHFGMIENAFIRVFDADTNKELCKFNLTEDYSGAYALNFGELYRSEGEWKFNAVGQPLNLWRLADLTAHYGLPEDKWVTEVNTQTNP
ncbi:MAG: TerD family protein [Hominimerdicola sp.]